MISIQDGIFYPFQVAFHFWNWEKNYNPVILSEFLPQVPTNIRWIAESYKVEMRALDRWVYSLFDAYGLETVRTSFTQEYLSYKVDILLYYFADDCACILAFWAASWSLVFGLQLAQAFE